MPKMPRPWLAAFAAAVMTAVLVTASAGSAAGSIKPCCGDSTCDTLKPGEDCDEDGDCKTEGFKRCCGDGPDEFGCSGEPGGETS